MMVLMTVQKMVLMMELIVELMMELMMVLMMMVIALKVRGATGRLVRRGEGGSNLLSTSQIDKGEARPRGLLAGVGSHALHV